jgi:uncharacterized protein with GYD domain
VEKESGGDKMPKFMYIGSYTAQGAKGALQEGGTSRRQAANKVIESVGGKVESHYFAFGKDDFFVTFEAPSAAAAAAAALTVGASGAISGRTIPLITPEELDEASRMSPDFRPPGS